MANKLSTRKAELTVKESTLPPLCKWAGGKGWMLNRVKALFVDRGNRRLVEPFCGGIAIAMGLNPDRALLNDINPDLINLYQCVKEGLMYRFVLTIINKEVYYANRKRFNQECDRHAKAILFYQLNRTGYNGLCRYNQKGKYNTPAGDFKNNILDHDFSAYKQIFKRWDFTCLPFEDLAVESNDFIFADPPYDDGFTTYSKGGFNWADQVRCAEWLAVRGVPTIATNKATPRIVELYSDLGFTIEYINAPRRIACNGDREPVREMFATKNLEAIAS